ncbi:MAG: PIG-L family deacetylase [Caldilineales bacterium]|nr:PIG-L family deacetylase [Caldilineales bacterium]
MSEQLRLMGVFAHPDDELSVGGTLARYATEGAAITVVCATRGEAATIFCDDCATRETLPVVRTGEMECCCAELGVQDLRWLDWPDGGVSDVPEAQAVAQLVSLVREIRPHVLFTHPPHGGYPHPDHIGVYERVMAAFSAAADPDFLPAAGPVWATPKVYVRAIPVEAFDVIPNFRDYRIQLNGQALAFEMDPPEHINAIIDCHDSVDARIRGWHCHRSQHNPNGTFSLMPEEMQRQIFSQEYLRLLAHNLPSPPSTPHNRLEAGLPEFTHE